MDYKFINFTEFINKINTLNKKLNIINYDFIKEIKIVINDLFLKLNKNDKKYLTTLTIYIVDLISYKYDFKNSDTYYNQWRQNNYRDIKSVILLLLPFIDDKDDGYLLKNITELSNLLYSKKSNNNELKQLTRDNINEYFKFGNMGLGLLNSSEINNKNTIYNDKMIYELIYHNFIGLLQTLEIINGKTYVNWINIVPFNFNNYSNSNLYKKTHNIISKIYNIYYENTGDNILNDNKQMYNIFNNCLIKYQGLWLGEFYNILRIKYYQELKKIKWLIFPYETETIQIYLIQGLNKMIDINFIINSESNNYEYLLENEKKEIENNLKNIVNNFKNKISLFGYLNIDIEIVKNLLIFFINNNDVCLDYTNIIKWKIYNEIIDDETQDDDYTYNITILINNITINDIIDLLNYIIDNNIIIYLWNYLKDVIIQFKYSVLYKFLVYYDVKSGYYKLNNKYYYEMFNNNFKKEYQNLYVNNIFKKINLKNIYNIAKHLSHNNDWTTKPINYLSLTLEQKTQFFYSIFNIHKIINIKNNLKKQYIDVKYNYNAQIFEISTAFMNILPSLIFEELIAAGSLNYFTVNLNITDKSKLPKDDLSLRKKRNEEILLLFQNNESEWNEAFYYLTNEQYKYTKIKYLSYLKNPRQNAWLLFYAMDWISQISFFHHYIFHQILYITGSTGQGKSTQVPKLLLYALKVIDYKSSGKIICTVPRTVPTIDNSNTIANQLGFPIVNNVNNKNISTDNYYIQFKHQEDAHFTNEDKHHLSLKIVTDGTLYEIIKENLIMKKINLNNNTYINQNIYDIIIIDEAHEHGINMDLILSLGRQTCILNNQIRLIIVSATMDNDELIYRQYYKMINDKLLYPIKSPIIEPILNNFKYVFNPVFMDRRYHISPPGESTQYLIDEEYENKEYNENELVELSIKKVLNICNLTNNGDILVFTNGEQEIFYIIEQLNKSLPDNVIALPFYSLLNEKYMSIVKNAQYKNIKTKKENIHIKWKSEFSQDKDFIPNYNRIVIVSTNIAEASITINSLTYVIDNGYAKVNIYDPILDINKLLIEKISESSRLQRKGRVGRVGYGKVFFLYPKNSRKNIISKYKITQENFAPHFINLFNNKPITDININDLHNQNKLLVTSVLHPYNINFFKIPIDNTNIYIIKSGLYNIYKDNYFINENNENIIANYYYILHNLQKNENFYYFNNNEYFNSIHFFLFNDGQILLNLLDQFGEFFIIHYFESKIIRNIYNQIIYFDNKKLDNVIPYNNYKYLIHYLTINNLIVNLDFEFINQLKYIKTEITYLLKTYSKIFPITYNYNHLLTLIYANKLNCLIPVFYLIILIHEILNNKHINIINNELSFNQAYKQFKQLYSNNKSEILLLYNIIEQIFDNFNYLLTFKFNYNIIKYYLKEEIKEIISIFLKSQNNIIPPNFNIELWNYLIKKKYNNELILEQLLTEYPIFSNTNIYKKIINNIFENEEKLIKWCNKNIINYKIITNFLIKITNYKFMNIFGYDIFNNNYNNNYDNILKSFIFGNPTNISFYNNENKKLISYFNISEEHNLNKIININTFSFINISDYLIFYYFFDINNNNNIEISFINEIKPEWLILTSTFFYYNIKLINKYKILKHIYYDIVNNWNYKVIWFNNDFPILNYYYKNIIKLIKKIEY